jgi:hypothetical protein
MSTNHKKELEKEFSKNVIEFALKNESKYFIGSILFSSVVYLLVTLLLNSIRATAPIWLVWILIGIQFLYYYFIFASAYRRSIVYGLSSGLALVVFVILAILGRVNDWEILVIPSMLVVMILISLANKRVSNEVVNNLKG